VSSYFCYLSDRTWPDTRRITNSSRRKRKHSSRFPEDSDRESKANGLPVVNLSTLVHDVVEGVFLGNVASENASDRDTSDDTTFIRNLRQGQSDRIALKLTETSDMVTIIDIDPSVDWRFKTEAGAWKRIAMNLFGNAMKFTQKGQITVKLHLTRRGTAESDTAQHIRLEISDTGTGIDKEYLESHLFTAFSQADDISVGTGVGLSIVKRLVEDLNGVIDIQSDVGIGTRVSVAIPLGEITSPVNSPDCLLHEEASLYANGRHKGHNLYVQSLPSSNPKGESDRSPDPSTTTPADADSELQTFFAILARQGFGMSVVVPGSPESDQEHEDASPHSISLGRSASSGAWNLCRRIHGDVSNATDGASNRTVVSIRQPFGPRTFASALDEVMAFTVAGAETVNAPARNGEKGKEREEQSPSLPGTSSPLEERHAPSPDDQQHHTAPATEAGDMTAHTQEPKPPEKASPRTQKTAAHLLLVDDNSVNLKVLAASLKKGGCTYYQAADGREAVDAFKANPLAYDLVFMDLSMPVLDGIEATREIRAFEEERGGGLGKRTQIIALTALDDKHRQRAFEAGVDDFITKPAKMTRVRELARQAWDG
jgi:CheY-like chemotaxis protein